MHSLKYEYMQLEFSLPLGVGGGGTKLGQGGEEYHYQITLWAFYRHQTW